MRLWLGVMAFVLVGAVTSVDAETVDVPSEYTAEAMYRLCKGTERDMSDDMQSFICTFRLQGLVSVMVWNCVSIEAGYDPAPYLTAGAPPSRGALRQAFTNYVEANPAEWGQQWDVIAAKAASGAFPCQG